MPAKPALKLRDPTTWPVELRRTIDAIATSFMQAYQLARGRAAANASPALRSMAERDQYANEIALLRRELDVQRRRIEATNLHKRPPITGADRFEVLQIMRLRGWNATQTAKRFVFQPNTIY